MTKPNLSKIAIDLEIIDESSGPYNDYLELISNRAIDIAPFPRNSANNFNNMDFTEQVGTNPGAGKGWNFYEEFILEIVTKETHPEEFL